MYRPDAFRLDDRSSLLGLAASCPFATVITRAAGEPEVSHLPLLIDAEQGVLRGHLARQNPQAAHLAAGDDVLALFHGPHGYVSPSVYADPLSVPTWNYVVVHARGRPRLVDDQALRRTLQDMVTRFDDTGWRPEMEGEFMHKMLGAIVGFEIQIERLEGKWKISQNRSAADQASVAAWLERGDASSRALAALMRARL